MAEIQWLVQVYIKDRKVSEGLAGAKELRKLLFQLKGTEAEIRVQDGNEWEAIEEEPVIQGRKKYQQVKERRKQRNWKLYGTDIRNG